MRDTCPQTDRCPPAQSLGLRPHRTRSELKLVVGALSGVVLASLVGLSHADAPADQAPSLDATRLAMSKWIETQQIISKERKEWQQGKEILLGRLELVNKEVAQLEDNIKKAESTAAEARQRSDLLRKDNDLYKAVGAQVTEAVTGMEGEVRRLLKEMPEPVKVKLDPLVKRIPEDPSKTRVSAAERFQNVLGVLNEINKSNNEILVNYEVHTTSDGKPSEVRAIYLGLAQAYYISASGEAGISHPTSEGWQWRTANNISRQVQNTIEIIQGKQTAAFVPLPVKIQ